MIIFRTTSGIYGRINGYRTRIFELSTVPGGQCASWKRKGYIFDACIHHLFGCASGFPIYKLWTELGTMPRETVRTRECVSVASPEGKLFHDYYETDALEHHLKELSPADAAVIDDYVHTIPAFARHDLLGEATMGSWLDLAKITPHLLPLAKWFKPANGQFAERFRDPFLRAVFPLVEYSMPEAPFFLHLAKHAYGLEGNLQWPVGGSLEFARSMEKRYLELGGEV